MRRPNDSPRVSRVMANDASTITVIVQPSVCRRAGLPPRGKRAEAEISDRDGHLTMIARIGEIHDWLLEPFQEDWKN